MKHAALRTLWGTFLLAGGLNLADPAAADPVTYSGKLGSAEIVVEFTDDPAFTDATPSARYFYVRHGIDIPLHGKPGKGGGFEMDEEEACILEGCGDGAPVAATWRLSARGDATLEGTWTGGRTLPVKLERVASRPQPQDKPRTPLGLYEFSDDTFFSEADITMENSPYDYLRLDVPLGGTDAEGWPDATFRYVHDPRTSFPMPRVVELAGGVPTDAANDVLRKRHWLASRKALSCAALRYRGFSENDMPAPWEGGSLGGIDESISEVLYLSPKLMSWQESGSIYCGGAHPHNYRDQYVMEVATGRLLELEDMFSDIVDGQAGPSLVAFVRETRGEPTDPITADFEEECGTNDLIESNLAAHLRREDETAILVFGLSGLGHAMGACEDDVLEVPAAQAVEHLSRDFAELLRR